MTPGMVVAALLARLSSAHALNRPNAHWADVLPVLNVFPSSITLQSDRWPCKILSCIDVGACVFTVIILVLRTTSIRLVRNNGVRSLVGRLDFLAVPACATRAVAGLACAARVAATGRSWRRCRGRCSAQPASFVRGRAAARSRV